MRSRWLNAGREPEGERHRAGACTAFHDWSFDPKPGGIHRPHGRLEHRSAGGCQVGAAFPPQPTIQCGYLARRPARSGIDYIRLPALGGWRRPRPDSLNTGWRLESFRGFADYMLTDEFRVALDDLIALACAGRSLAFMCAEAVPWRCHRSLIADALTARGYEVRHVMSVDKADLHRMTPFASVEGDLVTYPHASV